MTLFDIVLYWRAMKTERANCKEQVCCPPKGRSAKRRYAGLAEGAKLFRALADETRLCILKQLREEGEVCACHFLACRELGQPTVSYHLKVLREAGLVSTEKRGLWVYYTLNPEMMDAARALLP